MQSIAAPSKMETSLKSVEYVVDPTTRTKREPDRKVHWNVGVIMPSPKNVGSCWFIYVHISIPRIWFLKMIFLLDYLFIVCGDCCVDW